MTPTTPAHAELKENSTVLAVFWISLGAVVGANARYFSAAGYPAT